MFWDIPKIFYICTPNFKGNKVLKRVADVAQLVRAADL